MEFRPNFPSWLSRAVDEADAEAEAGGDGGSSSVVSCVLAIAETPINVHDVGSYPFYWNALYADLYNEDSLDGLPDGLGITASFDGTSNALTTTEAGIWLFSYSVQLSVADDATWEGWLDNSGDIAFQYYPVTTEYTTWTYAGPLVSGAVIEPRLRTTVQATTDPQNLFVALALTRLG